MIKLILAFLAPLLAVVLLVATPLYWTQHWAYLDLLRLNATENITLNARAMFSVFDNIRADLRLLARDPAVTAFAEHSGRAERDELVEQAIAFCRQKTGYGSLRILDLDGRELLKVVSPETGPIVVAGSKRASAGDSWSRALAKKMERGGTILLPWFPDTSAVPGAADTCFVLRCAAPIMDLQGARRGIVILDYRGGLHGKTGHGGEPNMAPTMGRSMFVDQEGRIITPDDGRGFLPPSRLAVAFPERFPRAWERVSRDTAGDFENEEGLFSFLSLPLNPGSTALEFPDRLILVHHLPLPILVSIRHVSLMLLSRSIVPIVLLFTLLSVFASWLWLRQRKAVEVVKEAMRTAEAANKAKSEFLAMMSHEIRTPMNGVIGMTELLMETELTDKQRHYAATIASSAESLLTIINDILDISRLEAGKLTLQSAAFDMKELVDQVGELMASRAKAKEIELIVSHAAGTPRSFVGDATRVRQILINLVGNAIKFTDKGQVRVNVELMPSAGAAAPLVLRVADTGIGMSREARDLIFERFVQVDTSSARRFQGSGLGLAICRQLIEMMGGTIDVESEPGRGSVFTVTLPLPQAIEEAEAAEGMPQVIHARAGDLQRPGKLFDMRVLVADDHPVNLMMAEAMLSGMGCSVTTAKNGRETVDKARDGTFDLILMDCQMPEMDGYEATRLIRASEKDRSSRMPIIALTASAVGGVRDDCLAAGMNDFLSKPFHKEQLVEILEKHASGRKTMEADEHVLNTSVLEHQLGGDVSMIRHILQRFLETNVQDRVALEDAATRSDMAAARETAHRIKGASATVGAENLSTVCRDIEIAARAGNKSVVDSLLGRFEDGEDQLIARIQGELRDAHG